MFWIYIICFDISPLLLASYLKHIYALALISLILCVRRQAERKDTEARHEANMLTT